MKKILFIMCLLAVVSQIQAQTNDRYVKAMEANIAILDTCHAPDCLQKASNVFERIAAKETKEWLPNYYVAYCQASLINFEKDESKWEALCDKGDQYIARADSLNPNNSEISVVKAMLASNRIRLSPMMNGMKYGPISNKELEKAVTQDPENPRAYLEQGLGKFYTPAMFGGSKEKALELFGVASKRFETFKPANTIAPNWGRSTLAYIVEQAKK